MNTITLLLLVLLGLAGALGLEEASYQEREAASQDLLDFVGGRDSVVIVGGCGCLVVALIVLLIIV